MVYPMFYMDEDNYEDYRKVIAEMDNGEKIFIGSGCDAPIAWEKSDQDTVRDLVTSPAKISGQGVQQ